MRNHQCSGKYQPTSGKFYFHNARLEIHKHSFSRFGIGLWNEILHCIRDFPKKLFKGEIHQLLDILTNKNDFFEMPIIIQKIGLAN